jgi:hypothetical protein
VAHLYTATFCAGPFFQLCEVTRFRRKGDVSYEISRKMRAHLEWLCSLTRSPTPVVCFLLTHPLSIKSSSTGTDDCFDEKWMSSAVVNEISRYPVRHGVSEEGGLTMNKNL